VINYVLIIDCLYNQFWLEPYQQMIAVHFEHTVLFVFCSSVLLVVWTNTTFPSRCCIVNAVHIEVMSSVFIDWIVADVF